ncbi:hypothetical protein HY497_01220 [Candidatus Woesearchaeota archaeon]|nr:hypothetical protein [Candidatus Woesearchaeota archaeon]
MRRLAIKKTRGKTKNMKHWLMKAGMRHSSRGQMFSIDTAVSAILFLIIALFVFSLWSLYTTRLNETIQSEELQLSAFQVMDILLKSKGVPNIWEETPDDVEVIGLQLNAGAVDKGKLDAFLAMDYGKTKAAFNIERFEYNFTVLDTDGRILNSTGTALSESAAQRVSLNRIVLIGNETRQVVFTLWGKHE